MDYQTLPILFFAFVIVAVIQGCTGPQKEEKNDVKAPFEKGSFGYDLDFLKKYYNDLVVLENGDASIVVSPALQGRVMTSTAAGGGGMSFGWLNYDYIAAGETSKQFNPVGGEERFWVGPEGGQFSLFFDQNKAFDFDNWRVPKEIDTDPFHLISSDRQKVSFQKAMKLTNYSGTVYEFDVDRNISLLNQREIETLLGIRLSEEIKSVGFESENTLTNTGENNWDKTSGMPGIWILSMLISSDKTCVIVPFKPGNDDELGKIVTDDYFGKVPSDRLVVKDSVLFFKADGNKRSKIGLSPQRSLSIAGSYDAKHGVLTITQFSLPEDNTDYVNSLWEIQEEPFAGDAFNSYNDGPLEDGGQLGPFYELESSSPVAMLNSGKSLTHFHRTYHFTGARDQLDGIINVLLNTDIQEIEAFLNAVD